MRPGAEKVKALVELFRLYAFPVVPQRTMPPEDFVAPVGSRIAWTTELEAALTSALAAARSMTTVDLRVDTTPGARTSDVRDCVMTFAFGEEELAAASASRLAARLSSSMDDRSKPGLFLAAAYCNAEGPRRQVALWIFPQEEAFRLSEATIELLNDIFSRTSNLRKLARFEGQNVRSGFITARVLDFQAAAIDEVARFWIERFLDAQLSISDEAGTRLLAQAIASVSDRALTPEEREQLQAAAIAIRTMPAARWSLEQFANQMLSDPLRETFLSEAPNDESRQSVFRLNRDVLDDSLRTRIFRLESGVTVYAPLGDVEGVRVTRVSPVDDAGAGEEAGRNVVGERLEVEGTVVEDKLSRRRG